MQLNRLLTIITRTWKCNSFNNSLPVGMSTLMWIRTGLSKIRCIRRMMITVPRSGPVRVDIKSTRRNRTMIKNRIRKRKSWINWSLRRPKEWSGLMGKQSQYSPWSVYVRVKTEVLISLLSSSLKQNTLEQKILKQNQNLSLNAAKIKICLNPKIKTKIQKEYNRSHQNNHKNN